MMHSLRDGYSAAVIGASGGIGGALTQLLADDPRCGRLWALSRRPGAMIDGGRATGLTCDILEETSLAGAAATIGAAGGLDLMIVATGVLQTEALSPEKSWRALSAQALVEAFTVNAVGPALAAKHFLPLLPRQDRAVFAALSARVGSISDNQLGGWYGYRASKAALNMLIRNLALEAARTRPQALCLALHPGTVETGLSQPFRSGVRHPVFTPAQAAAQLLAVINAASPAQSGRLLGWDGAVIPF